MAASDNPMPYNPVPLPPGPQGVNVNNLNLGSPAGTASLTAVMMGLGSTFTLTPLTTGRIIVGICGGIANSTASDGSSVNLRWGIGTAPVNGAAVTGNVMGGTTRLVNNASTAAVIMPFDLGAIVIGATLGVPIWIDAAVAAITGGTATLTSLIGSAQEI